ncbi:MAG: hypothetical protein SGI86_10895 [Deltaproteobacteria bacterium]|nr:hypothetical protein [Deltaproteobacteria bacterium]
METIGGLRPRGGLSLVLFLLSYPLVAAGAEDTPTLSFDPVAQALSLGVDHHLDLTFRIKGAGNAETKDVRVGANVGTIVAVSPQDDGAFVVRFDLPEKRFPQVAMIGASAQVGGYRTSGFVIVPLKALASPAFETDPGAVVTLKVGEKVYGPVRAGQDGRVRVPVVVPPGIYTATARSTGTGGKTTEQTIDLGLPDFPRILVLPPATVTAGENAPVDVFGFGPDAQPVDPSTLSLWYGARRLSNLDRKAGVASFLWTSPATAEDAVLEGRGFVPGETGHTQSATVRVLSAAIGKLQITTQPGRLGIGTSERVVLRISALDPWGRIRHSQPPALFVDGVPWSVRPDADESYVAEIDAPKSYDGRSHIHVDALVGRHHAHEGIELYNLPEISDTQATPERHRELEDSPVAIAATAGLTARASDAASAWFSAQMLVRVPRLKRVFASFELGHHRTRHSATDALGISRATIVNMPLLVGITATVFRVPRFVLLAGVSGGMSATYHRITSFGETDATRSFGLASKGAIEGALMLGPGQAVLGAQYLWFEAPQSSRANSIVGNSGGVGITMGYRWLF